MSPYHFLNLWRNPFGELTREERGELAVVELGDWIEFLADKRSVLQFIGPCGHGKTTHLLAIEGVLPGADYVYFPEDGPMPSVGDGRPMIIDEAQRMSRRQTRLVFKRGGPLVLSTHVDLSKKIIRAGLDFQTVDVTVQASACQLGRILNRRIHASRLSDNAIPCITEADVIRLQHQFGGNIRAIEQCLYDQFQRCTWEQTVWPPAT